MGQRSKTDYPGVYFRESKRIGGKGTEKVYYIVFKKNGKVIEEKVGRQFIDNITPAKASLIRGERIEGKRKSRREIKSEFEAKKLADLNKWTIKRLWKEYKINNPNIKGIKQDENRYKNYINTVFGDSEVQNISSLDVNRLRLKIKKKKAPATVNNVMELLRRIINFGIKNQLCPRPPFIISIPKVNNIKTEDLTSKQLKKLLIVLKESNEIQASNLMKFVLFTGIRRGEAFRLKWDDIDFEHNNIWLRDPKGAIDQNIPINHTAKDILKKHLRTESPYVFPGRNGGQRVDINKQVNEIKKRAGLPKDFRPLHGLRHTYASMIASSGQVDMYTLQKLLTHKSPSMTQRYAHLRDETLRKASDLADKIINQTTTIEDNKHRAMTRRIDEGR